MKTEPATMKSKSKPANSAEITPTAISNEGFPDGWRWVRLGDISDKVDSVKRTTQNPKAEFFYLDIGGIDNTRNKILDHKVYTWKDAPSRAQQIVRKNDILFSTVPRFAVATDDDDIIDSDFLGLTICDVLDCKLHELTPAIKTLFELGYVSTGICGNYKDVEKAFGRKEKFIRKRNVYTIFDLYDHVTATWAGYTEEDGDGYDNDLPTFNQQPLISDKTGRNDPCPCGSGKKYKKCCMDKN